MSADQKTLFSASEPNQSQIPLGSAQNESADAQVVPRSLNVWMLRTRALVFVTLCASFGVLLLILPWTSKWTDNSLLISFPDLREIVSSGFVRGAASGLGILDLWLGFWEAIHYHERSG